jgi:hypothetical protein
VANVPFNADGSSPSRNADGPSAPNSKKPVAFFVALGLFALTNLGIAAFSSTYQPDISKAVFAWSENDQHTKPWSWWLARKWLEQKQAPDVVLFGSSQMGSAMAASDAKHLFEVVDALTHRRAATLESELNSRLGRKYSAFSLASPGAMCSDAFMASSALFREDFKPKVVVIGISPRDFIDNTMEYPAVTEPFKFYSNYVNTGSLTLHSYAGPMAWLQFGMESLPCRKLGTRIQTELAAANQAGEQNSEPSKADTALAAIMGGGEAVPGKWRVPAVIPPMWQDNTKEYVRRFKNPKPGVYTAEKAFFAQFLAKMERDDIKVLVVGMPSLPMNRALLPDSFWNEFRASIGTMAHLHGAQFLDLTASNEFGKEDFLDTVHLDASGGEKLFAAIAKSIETEPTLCNSLTGRNELAIKAKPSKTQ